MRVHAKILCSAGVGLLLALNSCSHGQFTVPEYLAVTITPRPTGLSEGGMVQLTGAVSNNLSLPQWTLLNAADASNAGTLTAVSGSAFSILYTAPPAPPIYSAAAPAGFTQGAVTVEATVVAPAGSGLPTAHDAVTIFITAPVVSVALSPATVNVALNGSQLFNGYAVGNVNNALTWEVNGVAGGSASTGTITPAGIYAAPAVLPMTGNTVTVTVVSQADPTKSASATVTLM